MSDSVVDAAEPVRFASWPELVSGQSDRLGARPAITDDHGDQLSYADLAAETAGAAAAWAAAGVGAGDRVGLLGRNSAELLVNLLGLARLGAVPVLLSWRLSPTELGALGAAVAPVAVAADADLAEGAAAVLPEGLRRSLSTTSGDLPDTTRQMRTGIAGSEIALPSGEGTFVLLHSSGTTGLPKLIPLSYPSHIWGCRRLADLVGMEVGEVHLRFTPMFHLAGLQEVFTALLTGGHTVLRSGFDAEGWLDDVETHGVRFAHLPPSTLRGVLGAWDGRAAKPDLSTLRELWYGTAPISPSLLGRALEVFGCDLRQVYGLTEAQCPVSMLHPADHRLDGERAAEILASAGKPLPEWEVRLVATDGTEVGLGEPGEILLRGPQLFAGYWTRDGLASEAVGRDGWYHTGDVARLDAEGYLYIVDRLKDMVVSGGENVFPAEVEGVLVEHPGVSEVAVIGVPDERWGESVHAVLVPAPGQLLAADELLAWARQRLAGFKCPRSVQVVSALPRNASGKVLKRDLRAPHWADRTRWVN